MAGDPRMAMGTKAILAVFKGSAFEAAGDPKTGLDQATTLVS